MEIKRFEDTMPDSKISAFFKKATGRKYSNKETCVNDIRRMLMLFYNEKITSQQDVEADALGFTCSNCGTFQKDDELCPKCGKDPSTA